MGAQGRAPIAFIIDDIPLGAPQVAYMSIQVSVKPPGALVVKSMFVLCSL